MNRNQITKEKVCAFYASDYHFEMMSLPYINERIEKNDEIIVITENNLEDTISNLISKMNLQESKKEKILNIDWKNNDLDKFKMIKDNLKNEKNSVIFIKGKANYIKNINENIEKWTKDNTCAKVIDCYDIEEIGEDMNDVMKKYTKILNTSGEKNFQNF